MELIQLADTANYPMASNFYHRYKERIMRVGTIYQRNSLLSDMNEYFQRYVRAHPWERDEISEIYQLLKRKCMEVI